MRRPLAFIALGLLALSSCSATLSIRGTAPTQDNAGSACTAPVLVPNASTTVMVHVQVTGPAAREDSVRVAKGGPFLFTYQVPTGLYGVRAWASDSGGASCDTTLSVLVKNPPWKVAIQ